jgi:hypothetical protein
MHTERQTGKKDSKKHFFIFEGVGARKCAFITILGIDLFSPPQYFLVHIAYIRKYIMPKDIVHISS